MYASLLGISGALYLSVFEQPVSRVFFSTLLVDHWLNVAVALMSLKYFLNEKALTIVLCVIGVLAVAYGMTRPNHILFIIGLVFVIGGYLRIRKKLKESIQKKNEISHRSCVIFNHQALVDGILLQDRKESSSLISKVFRPVRGQIISHDDFTPDFLRNCLCAPG